MQLFTRHGLHSCSKVEANQNAHNVGKRSIKNSTIHQMHAFPEAQENVAILLQVHAVATDPRTQSKDWIKSTSNNLMPEE